MSAERIAELKARILSSEAQLLSIGFPIPELDTEDARAKSNAAQNVIHNRIYSLASQLTAARGELQMLTESATVGVPDDFALLHIVMHLTPSATEANKVKYGKTAFAAWKTLCREAAAGTI